MDLEQIGYFAYMNECENEVLTPSFHGKDCLHNGEHEGYEIACDECNYYLECFPDWRTFMND